MFNQIDSRQTLEKIAIKNYIDKFFHFRQNRQRSVKATLSESLSDPKAWKRMRDQLESDKIPKDEYETEKARFSN